MRSVLQASAWYPPHSTGGTEIYLQALVSELRSMGVQSDVVVPRATGAPVHYEHQGTNVLTYPVNDNPSTKNLHGTEPHNAFDTFLDLLRLHKKSIYHQHSWTRGCGPHHLAAAKAAGMRTMLTVHVPSNICLRGTMVEFGTHSCDGHVSSKRCGACWLHSRGIGQGTAKAITSLPIALAKMAHSAPRMGGIATAFSARVLGLARQSDIKEMIRNADHIVAVCKWLYDALEINGVPKEKLSLSRQGIETDLVGSFTPPKTGDIAGANQPLKLLYLGRWDPDKGIDIAAQAIAMLPEDMLATLTIHAIDGGDEGADAKRKVQAIADEDKRISIRPPVPRNKVATLLSEFDAIIVPSICMETGPLVVLEAQAAGLYVLGSRRGGIAELVNEPDDGVLIEPGDVGTWSQTIQHVANMKQEGGLPNTPRPRRTMADAAKDMSALYARLA